MEQVYNRRSRFLRSLANATCKQSMSAMQFTPIPEIITAIKNGEMIVLVDDENRENEGDLVCAAEFASEQHIAFMATRGCGLVCLSMEGEMLDRLGLPMMTRDNRSSFGTAFTLSIEAAEGVTTGISAGDRMRTIQAAIADDARPSDIVSPGHVFPLRARDGGVLVRAGHSEASVDLCRLAGLKPAGVICEIMKPDGEMARLPDLEVYCEEHGLKLACIADLIAYREEQESLVELAASCPMQTDVGEVQVHAFRNKLNGDIHLAIVVGEQLGPEKVCEDPVVVRVQQEAVLGDVLPGADILGSGSLGRHLQQIAEEGGGVLLYIRDGRGQRLLHQLKKHGAAMEIEPSEAAMDPRLYGIGAQILRDIGVRQMRLLSFSKRSMKALKGYGIELLEHLTPHSQDG